MKASGGSQSGLSARGRGSAPKNCSGHAISHFLAYSAVGCGFEGRAVNKDSGTAGPPTPAYQKPRRPRRVSQAGCPLRVPFSRDSRSRRVWA